MVTRKPYSLSFVRSILVGFVAIQDELGRLAGCSVAQIKFHVETIGQLFALIQTGAKFPYFDVCALPFEWSPPWFCCANPHGDLPTELGTSLYKVLMNFAVYKVFTFWRDGCSRRAFLPEDVPLGCTVSPTNAATEAVWIRWPIGCRYSPNTL